MKKNIFLFGFLALFISVMAQTTEEKNCQAKFKYDASNPAKGVDFYDLSYNRDNTPIEIAKWKWVHVTTGGEFVFSTEQNPKGIKLPAGENKVCLSILTKDGCISSVCQGVFVPKDTIKPPVEECVAKFVYDASNLEEGVRFKDVSYSALGAIIDIVAWEWSIRKEDKFVVFSTKQTPEPLKLKEGKYVVCLKIKTKNGCVSEFCDIVTVGDPIFIEVCHAMFKYVVDENDKSVDFYGLALNAGENISNLVKEWKWEAYTGDGIVSLFSTEQNPQDVRFASEKVEVCLSYVATNGCSAKRCEVIYLGNNIDPSENCNVYFEYEMNDEGKYNFYGMPTFDVTPNTKIKWTIQSETTYATISEELNIKNLELEKGKYEVCLYVDNPDINCQAMYCDVIYVGIAPEEECVAYFHYWYSDKDNTINFADNSYPGNDNKIIEWEWVYVNEAGEKIVFSNEPNPANVSFKFYPVDVCLQIKTEKGCISSFCNSVDTVKDDIGFEKCYVYFKWLPVVSNNSLVNFKAEAFNYYGEKLEIIQYYWSITYKGVEIFASKEKNPKEVKLKPGENFICLTVITEDSCKATYCDVIIASSGGNIDPVKPCFAYFEYETVEASTNSKVLYNFYDKSYNLYFESLKSIAWHWTYKVENQHILFSTEQNPKNIELPYNYMEVCLTVKTADGCKASYCSTTARYETVSDTISFNKLNIVDTLKTDPIDTCLLFEPEAFYITDIIIEGKTVTLTWEFVKGDKIQQIKAKYNWRKPGINKVILTLDCKDGKKGLKSYLAYVSINEQPLNINETKVDDKVVVYPNPANSELNIQATPPFHIYINDLQGRLVMSLKSETPAIITSVENLSNGIYLIKVNDGSNQTHIKKLIIAR